MCLEPKRRQEYELLMINYISPLQIVDRSLLSILLAQGQIEWLNTKWNCMFKIRQQDCKLCRMTIVLDC